MRIIGLICNCHNSESLVRSIFREAELSNWLEIPVYKGNRAKEVVAELRSKYTESQQPIILEHYLENKSSYAIVLGYDPETQYVKWSDVALGDLSSRIAGVAIAKQFDK